MVKTASGANAVQVVYYRNRKRFIFKHIGSASSSNELESLKLVAQDVINNFNPEIPLFEETKLDNLLYLDKIEFLGVYSTFLYEVISGLISQVGLDRIQKQLLLDLVTIRIVEPASKQRSIELLESYFGIKHRRQSYYQSAPQWLLLKEEIESIVVEFARRNYAFDFDLLFYDVTNTYFEGRMQGSKIAKFGRSKEKRSDARIVVLAVVVNREGFLKYSNIFEGNMADCKTLGGIIDALSIQTSSTGRKPIVVIDAGIATEDNLTMLRGKGYDYMCVSRSSLKEYHADTSATPVQITDKRKQPIELLKVRANGDNDQYLWVRSQAKAMKENSMNGLLSQRFEEGIQCIQEGITKKGGTKKLNKVYERVGRLKQKYPSVHTYYDITVCDDGNGLATSISCRHKKGEDPGKQAGIYFLRTSLMKLDECTFWAIYNVIREIEYTFRVLKTDLDLRPIYHKTDDASMAHLNLGLLAYWLVATIRYQLKQNGMNSGWREIVRSMNTQKCLTTSVVNIERQTILIRQCTEPTKVTKAIYDWLKYKYVPFTRKKSVGTPAEILKNDSP
ncbi:MAG: IS1634 family transposase [Bacteroidales bacterium]|nr:IS1634 family transposase [Bacteroidales bacterium]